MKTLLTLSLLFFCVTGFAQTHIYNYDPSGNRIEREYVMLRMKQQAEDPTQFVIDSNITKEESYSLKAFPNPFNEAVTIQVVSDQALEGGERLFLFSESGQIIQEFTMNQKTKRIETQNLANGKYIVKFISREETHQYLLIKTN